MEAPVSIELVCVWASSDVPLGRPYGDSGDLVEKGEVDWASVPLFDFDLDFSCCETCSTSVACVADDNSVLVC